MCVLRAKIVLPVSKSNSGQRIAARLQRGLLSVCVVACCLKRAKFSEMIHAHGQIHYFIFIYYLVRSRARCSTLDGSFIQSHLATWCTDGLGKTQRDQVRH